MLISALQKLIGILYIQTTLDLQLNVIMHIDVSVNLTWVFFVLFFFCSFFFVLFFFINKK